MHCVPFFCYISAMNHLIKLLLLSYLFFLSNLCCAQEPKEHLKVSFSIRGKYLLGGILEDLYWRTYHAGGEVFIGDRHAIGIDGGVFRTRRERDDDNNTAMYSDITRRSYMYLDYKYIYPFNYGKGYKIDSIFISNFISIFNPH